MRRIPRVAFFFFFSHSISLPIIIRWSGPPFASFVHNFSCERDTGHIRLWIPLQILSFLHEMWTVFLCRIEELLSTLFIYIMDEKCVKGKLCSSLCSLPVLPWHEIVLSHFNGIYFLFCISSCSATANKEAAKRLINIEKIFCLK